MATLDVPLHIPIVQLEGMLSRELRYREVTAVKVRSSFMRIEHERRPTHEIIAEIESCNQPLTFV